MTKTFLPLLVGVLLATAGARVVEAAVQRLPSVVNDTSLATVEAALWTGPGATPESRAARPSGSLSQTLFDPDVVPASTSMADYVAAPPVMPSPAYPMYATASAFPPPREEMWCLQVLPDGVIYRSYLAGMKESRFASQWVKDRDSGKWLWDIALGGRAAILRYGTQDALRPEGWEIDIEGAAFPQLDMDESRDLVSCDYRFGIPVAYGTRRYQTKFGYYHLSSHLGDEFMEKHSGAARINYCRDVLLWGHSFYLIEDLRLYFEADWAFYTDGGSEPWEFQFGVEYSPAGPTGLRGTPFWALHGHLREELDFGGNLVVQVGWQWRGTTGHLFRLGFHYYAGYSDQYEFYNDYVDKIGMGIWYDF